MGDSTVLITQIDEQGSTQTAQAFFQWKYKNHAEALQISRREHDNGRRGAWNVALHGA